MRGASKVFGLDDNAQFLDDLSKFRTLIKSIKTNTKKD